MIGLKKNSFNFWWLAYTCTFLPWISEGKVISHISTCKFNMEFSLLQNKVRTQSHYYIQIQLVSIEIWYIWAHLNMHGFFRIRCPQRWLICLLFIFNTSLRTQIINLVIMFYYYLIWCIYQASIILAIFLFLNNKDLIQQYHIFIQWELILINVNDNKRLHMMTRS